MACFRRQLVFLLIGTLAAVFSGGATARAQEDRDAAERALVDAARQARNMRAVQQSMRLALKSQFDRFGRIHFGTLAGARSLLARRLASRLIELDAECHLTAAQLAKLQLAGRGIIKRYIDRLDGIAAILADSKSSVDDLRVARIDILELEALTVERLFDDDSLLGKTLASTLDLSQAAEREKTLLRKTSQRHRNAIVSAVGTLRANLALTEEQCARLTHLLLSETRPPRKFGDAHDVALVLFQASRIPEEKLKSVFDEAQWRTISRWLSAYAGREAAVTTLEKHGFLFDDRPAVRTSQRVRPASNEDAPGASGRGRHD